MSPRKKKPALFVGPRQQGPHGKTVELNKIQRPTPTPVVEYTVEEVKSGKLGVFFRRTGVWNPHTNPDRDTKRNARLRTDEPYTPRVVERPLRRKSKATGGRQVLIPRTGKAMPHPWKMGSKP